MYHGEVDVDMLNTIKSLLADVSSVNPWSEQGDIIESALHSTGAQLKLKIRLTFHSLFQESSLLLIPITVSFHSSTDKHSMCPVTNPWLPQFNIAN